MPQTKTSARATPPDASQTLESQIAFFFYAPLMGFRYSSAVKLILLLIVFLHVGAALVKVLAVDEEATISAFEVFSFSLDAGLPFYGLICVLAIAAQFQNDSIALSMSRRPNRNHLYFREVAAASLLALVIAALFSAVLFCITWSLSLVGSRVVLDEDFYVNSAQLVALFCVAVFVLALASSALSFIFRSTAGSVIAYTFFLWLLPIAAASLSFYDQKLGELLVTLSPASILSDLTSTQFSAPSLSGGLAWVAGTLVIGRFRFERYTP